MVRAKSYRTFDYNICLCVNASSKRWEWPRSLLACLKSECTAGQRVKLLEPGEKDEERMQCATDFTSGMFYYLLYTEEGSKFLNRTDILVLNSVTY